MPRMTLDNHGLMHVRRANYLKAGLSMYDKNRAPMTLVLSIKTMGRFVRPLPGMREKRVFYNRGFDMIQVIWWQYLGNITYLEARQKVCDLMDQLAARLHRGEPIVAMRATLVDWYSGRALPKSVAKEPWFFDKTWGESRLDRMRLRGWGIKIDDGRIQYDRVSGDLPALNAQGKAIRKIKHFDQSSSLENLLESDLQSVVARAARRAIAEIPRYLSIRGVMLTSMPDAMRVRKTVVTLQSRAFGSRCEGAMNAKYENDNDWAARLRSSNVAKRIVENEALKWITAEVRDRLLAA